MQRYFSPVIDNQINLSIDDVHHIIHVMRMTSGDLFEVVDQQKIYVVQIITTHPFSVKIIDIKYEDSEINENITLFFALAKGDKIDLVIQKATELGVHQIVLFRSKRCVTNFDNKDINKKIERFYKIAKEASEQSHRLLIPEIIGVIDIKDADKYKNDINYVAYEKCAGKTTNSLEIQKDHSISIMIGPEGGFDESEIEMLNKMGFQSISLGKRILRCETAAIYALSVLSFELEK